MTFDTSCFELNAILTVKACRYKNCMEICQIPASAKSVDVEISIPLFYDGEEYCIRLESKDGYTSVNTKRFFVKKPSLSITT